MPKKDTKKQTDGRRFRSGLTVRTTLIAATLVAGGALAYIPVTDYFELRGELHELEVEGDELRDSLGDAELEKRIIESQNAERALCYANYVEIGSETYAIPGNTGCAQSP